MKLKYNSEGNFRILQLTDTHFGGYPFNEADLKTMSGIKKIVNETNPDLIAITGDIIYSLEEHGAHNPKVSFYEFSKWINTLNTPIAITLGNHESEDKVKRHELIAIFGKEVTNGVEKLEVDIVEDRESYIVPIYNHDESDIENILFFIDSGDYSNTPYSYYAWVLKEQINWFTKVADKYKKGDGVKRNLMFQHIPIPEYWLASQNIQAGNFNEDFSPASKWLENINLPIEKGIFSPDVNSGLFLEMLLNGEIWGMFAGHDHDNSFDGLLQDIHLVYGQSSGYNTYGDEAKGGRIIDLNNESNNIKTYSVYYEK